MQSQGGDMGLKLLLIAYGVMTSLFAVTLPLIAKEVL